MNRFKFFVVLAAIFLAPAAFAQTPTYISIVSGNGQVICPNCTLEGYGLQSFAPLYVRVTDANGNPVANSTVNWTVTTGQGYFGLTGTQTAQSFTDANGNTSIQYVLQSQLTGSSINPYLPTTISATIANNATVNFYLTLALVSTTSINVNVLVFVQVENLTPTTNQPCATCTLNPGDTLTGTAGSTSAVQFAVSVYVPGGGPPVPNVSLRLIPNQASPSVACATEAGADPGSVLTDANGLATCSAIIGPNTGFGTFSFLVGGVTAAYSGAADINGNPIPVAFFQSGNYNLNVTPGVAGMISITSGNTQGGNPGQTLPLPLVATVADAGGNPLAGAAVVWTVSPASAATLSNTITTSNSGGQVQTYLTLGSTTAGPVQVKVALANNPSISATFTISANVQVSGLQIISGNAQSAVVNTPFPLPLLVQVSTSNGQSLANVPVSFVLTSGSATLSATTATTNSAGQAQVSATAGPTAGAVFVTASAGGVSQTFNLTVVQQGPTLGPNSFYNGADFQLGAISPCSIATIIAPGLAPAIQGVVTYGSVGALPYTLGGDTVTVNGAQAPIYNVANSNGQQQVTFQVPCGVTPGSLPVTVNVSGASATVTVPVLPSSPGIFTSQVSSTVSVPVLERPDGSFVSPTNPARRGETVIAFVTGLGPTSPAVATNSLPVPGSTASVLGTVIVGVNGNGASLISASLTPDIVGVYEVAFQVPSSAASGANASFSIGVLPQGSGSVNYSSLQSFPVQ